MAWHMQHMCDISIVKDSLLVDHETKSQVGGFITTHTLLILSDLSVTKETRMINGEKDILNRESDQMEDSC
jgi:hypothetical protein